jgi:5'-3' exonuclease
MRPVEAPIVRVRVGRVAGPLLLLDAPYLLYRAFFALPSSIEGSDGRPVNALLGAVNTVLAVVEEEDPRAVVACFGPDAAAYRVELYRGYHAHRPPMPDDLSHQWERAPGLLRSLGWHVHEHAELEADDLLGAYAHAEEGAGGTALIVTGDRDLFQCVTDSVEVLLLGGRGKSGPQRVGAAEVERRYCVDPTLVPDFIALRGDPSDGLPGAKGIGEKRAADILRRHGSLQAALERAERDGERVNALAAVADQLRSFREVAALRPIDVDPPPDTLTDLVGGAEAARELGMERLAKRLEKAAGRAPREGPP